MIEVMISLISPFVKQTKHKDDEIKVLKECYIETSGQRAYYTKYNEAKKL